MKEGWITTTNITLTLTSQDPDTKTVSCYASSETLGETIVQTFNIDILCKYNVFDTNNNYDFPLNILINFTPMVRPTRNAIHYWVQRRNKFSGWRII